MDVNVDMDMYVISIFLLAYIGEIYNVGSDTEMSNLDVLRTLLQLFGLEKEEEKVTVMSYHDDILDV